MAEKRLGDFINSLEVLLTNNHYLISKIKSPTNLLKALRELDDLVEMYEAKEMVIQQIQDLIINSISDTPKNSHMSHVVISGPPGTGKSKLGVCLANIWNSLGLIKISEDKNKKEIINKNLSSFEISQRIKNIVYNKEQISDSHLTNRIKSLTKNPKKSDEEIIKELEDLIRKKERQIKRLSDKNSERIGLTRKSFALLNKIETNKYRSQQYKYIDYIRNNLKELIKGLQEDIVKNSDQENNEEKEDSESKFIIASRAEFVDLYVGWTAKKTRKFLEDNLGKVIFIDEAYSLINSDRDSFGSEALTEIIKFMSEHPGEIIIQFAGYKEKLKETIFHPAYGNPGLERRCAWTFNVEGYSAEGLAKIFLYQAKKMNWLVDPEVNLNKFIQENKDDFNAYGGDTEKLVFYISLICAEEQFKLASKNHNISFKEKFVVKKEHLALGLEFLKKNKLLSNSNKEIPESFKHLFM